jgi:putative membrane protein
VLETRDQALQDRSPPRARITVSQPHKAGRPEGDMRRALIRLLIYVLSLGLAARLVDGVDLPGPAPGEPPGALQVIGVALLFGLLNVSVKPLLQLASCGLYIFTLGLFHFVINALVLQLTGWLAPGWLHVAGFWPAFQGALIISLTSTLLVRLLDPEDKPPPEPPPPVMAGDVIDGVYEAVNDRRQISQRPED